MVCMPVALYLRVSTEEQRERQSIATQRDFAERYCAQHHLTVVAIYADDGVSGTVPLQLRPAGARIMPDARIHRFDQLLVYRLDRLGRDTRLTNPVATVFDASQMHRVGRTVHFSRDRRSDLRSCARSARVAVGCLPITNRRPTTVKFSMYG